MPKDKTEDIAKKQVEELEHLDRAYARLFDEKNSDAKIVLEDLRRICFVDVSTANPNQANMKESMLINEGCRRVFLRIAQKIRMDWTTFYRSRQKETTTEE